MVVLMCVTSVLLSLSDIMVVVVCNICVVVIVRQWLLLCVTSVLLSLSDTMVVVVCDICVVVIVRHNGCCCV